MAVKTVEPRGYFPVGTAVEVYPYEANEVAVREKRPPNIAATTTGTIDTDGTIDVTANAGLYVMVGTINEVQTVTVDATNGDFNLTFVDQTTTDMAHDVSAANMQTALRALSNIGASDVTVTGGPGDDGGTTPYVVTFVVLLGGEDVAEMTGADGVDPLTGGAATVTVATTSPGSGGTAGSTRNLIFTVDA